MKMVITVECPDLDARLQENLASEVRQGLVVRQLQLETQMLVNQYVNNATRQACIDLYRQRYKLFDQMQITFE